MYRRQLKGEEKTAKEYNPKRVSRGETRLILSYGVGGEIMYGSKGDAQKKGKSR